MNYPEDRVLVCVVNRKRDFERLRDDHWYRIPHSKMPDGVQAEILAFFFSRAFAELNGAIHTYARITGTELAYRQWLLPAESAHTRAGEVYYRVAVAALERKHPPIANPGRRTLAFIRTTWERFAVARSLDDLYMS